MNLLEKTNKAMCQVGFLHFVYFFIQNDKYILRYVEYIYNKRNK